MSTSIELITENLIKDNIIDEVKTRIKVQNICCEKEASLINRKLGNLDGIIAININIIGRIAYITHDKNKIDQTEIL
jgi:copper chaperone CopZ